ncbi:hypothetical protein FB45DRAFT_1018336 [Roridomyces roridus]|uniref:F-box domain-containing protein n=1 Tax=Roridomyces roridus TaxID=1738132 RepID=A0AAD7CKB8_9AGAR|nr:hypothetical protein FB45DRAFT_1018336 [Roridomyces roridus]
MNDLPNELLDDICSYLGKDELQAMIYLSSRIRHVASLPFLRSLGITESDIQAGTVKLTLLDSLHLLLFVAHICPIQELVYLKDPEPDWVSSNSRVASILGAIDPIPDILIQDRLNYTGLDRFLRQFPQASTDTLLIVAESSVYVAPPLRTAVSSPFPTSRRTMLKGMHNLLVGQTLSVGERIATASRISVFEGPIRIQALPDKHTLVTFALRWHNHFTIEPIPSVADSVYSALITTLDLGPPLEDVQVEPKSNISYADLVAFLNRHKHIRYLTCAPNSIRPSSFTETEPNPNSPMVELKAPASYISYLLPFAPNVPQIYISCLSMRPPFRRRPVFDQASYVAALDAIARSPRSLPRLSLSLAFDLAAKNLPWETDMSDTPESRLTTVDQLLLRRLGSTRYSAADIRALTPWLGRFSSLRYVYFARGSSEAISDALTLELKGAICAACPGVLDISAVRFDVTVGRTSGRSVGFVVLL